MDLQNYVENKQNTHERKKMKKGRIEKRYMTKRLMLFSTHQRGQGERKDKHERSRKARFIGGEHWVSDKIK